MNQHEENTKREIHKFRLFTNSRGYTMSEESDGHITMVNPKVPGCKMIFDPSAKSKRYTCRFFNKEIAYGSTLELFRKSIGSK